jgi:hypothetical protein
LYIFKAFCINFFIHAFPLSFSSFTANTGLYAHYVFNTLDKDHTGTLSFEVSVIAVHLIQFATDESEKGFKVAYSSKCIFFFCGKRPLECTSTNMFLMENKYLCICVMWMIYITWKTIHLARGFVIYFAVLHAQGNCG